MSELPLGWLEVTLGQITSKPQYGYTTKSESNGIVRYLRTTDLTSGKVNWKNVPYCVDIPNDVSKYQLEDRDIVISRAGSVGFHTLLKSPPSNAVFASYLIRFKPSIHIDERYLSHFLNSKAYWTQITDKSAGVAVQNVNAKKLADLYLPLAPLNEQIRIADKLDSILAKVDQAQARLEKIPHILKRFRQSVLAAATSGELTREWRETRSNNINHEFLAHAIKDYDSKSLSELPAGWIFIPFEHAANIKSNLVDPKLTPDAIHLAPNHIEQNSGKILERATVADDGVTSSKHKFFSGQIIYSKIRPYLNKVCLVDFDGVCSADMYPIEAKSNTKYLLYFMLSEMFLNWTSQQQGRVVLPKINQKALNKIPVAFPPEDEQIEIVRRVDELLSHANTVEKNFVAAKRWFDRVNQSVLAKAFQGKLVSQDSNDEPAIQLLERIKQQQLEAPKPTKKTRSTKEKAAQKVEDVASTEESIQLQSEVLSILQQANVELSAQQLMDKLTEQSFEQVDALFTELKCLLDAAVISKAGSGESCTFKVIKK